jgi:cystathionine beta-lyase
MALVDGRYRLDLDALDRAYAAGGDLLILCNPHNPLGRVMEPDELTAISKVVARHGGRVFADEIHAPLVYAPHRHLPYASISPVAAGHTVTATSASKAWNLPGLKCAQMLLSNDADRQRWEEIGLLATHGASNLGVVANTVAYRQGRPWLERVLGYLDGNRRLLADLLAEHLPMVGYTPPEGTYLCWLDCRELGLTGDLAAFFTDEADVVLVDGVQCGPANQGFVRLNLATSRPILTRMVSQMGAAVARRARAR